MPNTFFTSDTHFGHAKIIEYCKRPFESIEAMDEGIVKAWNSVIGPKDWVYHMGDVLFHKKEEGAKILWSLNGNIVLIKGNHDEKLIEKTWYHSRFIEIFDILERKIEGQRMVLCHFPLEVWNHGQHGAWHLHGHSHGTLAPFGKRLDMGVDNVGFAPMEFSQLKEYMDKQEIVSRDYHQPRDENGKVTSSWVRWQAEHKSKK